MPRSRAWPGNARDGTNEAGTRANRHARGEAGGGFVSVKAGRRGSSEDDRPRRWNHAQDRGDGRGLNPSPDEHGPAGASMNQPRSARLEDLQVIVIGLRSVAGGESGGTLRTSWSGVGTSVPALGATASGAAAAARRARAAAETDARVPRRPGGGGGPRAVGGRRGWRARGWRGRRSRAGWRRPAWPRRRRAPGGR